MCVDDFKYEDYDFVSFARRHICVTCTRSGYVAFVLPILRGWLAEEETL
jgi:hypothetical protein